MKVFPHHKWFISMKYVTPEIISLKNHPDYNEKWLQGKIEEDPSILGLGELSLRGSEVRQPGGGRLDTLLYDPEDNNRRYEVEIQLGKTDESHIIRTIEYWDLERKRNPQYEHCAVIIAEDITSRFLNVISLFNGFIPLIAIQVKALKIEDTISLFFTKVLDELRLDLHEEDMKQEIVNRDYWEKRATKNSLKLADSILAGLGNVCLGYKLKYNKPYIGIEKNGIVNNFIQFIPRKSTLIMSFKLEKANDIDELLDNSDLDVMSYDKQWKQYRLRLKDSDVKSNWEIIQQLTEKASHEYRN